MSNNDEDDNNDKDNIIANTVRLTIIVMIIKVKMTISVKSISIIDKWLTEYSLAKDVSHLPFSFSPHLLEFLQNFSNTKRENIKKAINYDSINSNNNPTITISKQ